MTPRELVETFRWLPAYVWQRVAGDRPADGPVHLVFALADHFEPAIVPSAPGTYAPLDVQEQRLENWCTEYPRAFADLLDAEGRPFCHTYFYPAEQYQACLLERLADHCRRGWGEIEIHLHHGVEGPDTAEHTRRLIAEFRDTLATHGCLSRLKGKGGPRFAFVHGNWALANSNRGLDCGVDEEMQILADTGCFADFTLPAAPNPAQVAKINALYEPEPPLDRAAPHRRGYDLRVGRAPAVFPLIFSGPLMWNLKRRKRGILSPSIENSEVAGVYPPTAKRLQLWRRANITVRGRQDWIFIKLHTHGMDPRSYEVMMGAPIRRFLSELVEGAKTGKYQVHFVSAREMVNIALAACDGKNGNPGDFRDYRFIRLDR
jgi:hypothetical protein